MTDYCLTTSVKFGKGTITQVGVGGFQGCDGAEVGPDLSVEVCADYYPEGLSGIVISATPENSNGWFVERWEMRNHATNDLIDEWDSPSNSFSSVLMTMPSFDVDVQVVFGHPGRYLEVTPVGSGCVALKTVFPQYLGDCKGDAFSYLLPPLAQLEFEAVPDNNNVVVDYWIDINGDTVWAGQTTVFFTIPDGTGNLSIEVHFGSAPICDKNALNITIVGNGSVSPPSGNYCEDDILTLTPMPSYGYFFKRWDYDISSGISESGITLIVPMLVNRSVTAIFEPLPSFELPEGNLFYCASTTDKSNVVSFDFTNDEGNPSVYNQFHFRVNFYSDSCKLKLLYSASSLADNKRWFYNDSAYEPISSDGVTIEVDDTMNIVYDPEIFPQQITETQKEKSLNSSVYETPLVCGVKYYVEVESYNPFDGVFSFIKTISLILSCDEVDSNYWSYNKDANNWLCSGQGKSDLQVSSSSQSQSIFSDVASDLHGLFQIVWQVRRDGKYQVYGAKWDSELDYLYSSGQGGYDKLELIAGYDPIVFADQANNFYISGHTGSDIYIKSCPLLVSVPDTPDETSTDAFAKLCGPGINVYLSTSYDQIKARVREEDIIGSLVINSDKVVPIINKKLIRLDIDGIAGAYAVRLRNINDADWGGWINIDNNLYYDGDGGPGTADDFITPDDTAYNAYRIDNSRFIVPWDVDRNNGLKRICCQVLTMYGITNTFCLDLFFNFDVPRHVFEFYKDLGREDEFSKYNGQYVLSLLKDESGEDIGDSATVYFKVIFNEPIYKNESTLERYSGEDALTFNVIQQGSNDNWDVSSNVLTVSPDNKTFLGEFKIHREDGIFNKDGNSFIEIIFPEVTISSGCLSDSSDKYNLMIRDNEAAENKDLTPEEVYSKIQTNQAGKVFDINQFKQYYDQDDDNFKFGNPGYFRG